jgi:hypothetical protein
MIELNHNNRTPSILIPLVLRMMIAHLLIDFLILIIYFSNLHEPAELLISFIYAFNVLTTRLKPTFLHFFLPS